MPGKIPWTEEPSELRVLRVLVLRVLGVAKSRCNLGTAQQQLILTWCPGFTGLTQISIKQPRLLPKVPSSFHWLIFPGVLFFFPPFSFPPSVAHSFEHTSEISFFYCLELPCSVSTSLTLSLSVFPSLISFQETLRSKLSGERKIQEPLLRPNIAFLPPYKVKIFIFSLLPTQKECPPSLYLPQLFSLLE